MIEHVRFESLTSNQHNIWLLDAKVKEIIDILNKVIDFDELEELPGVQEGTEEGQDTAYPEQEPEMKPGVTYDGHGHYRQNGLLIKKAEAFL